MDEGLGAKDYALEYPGFLQLSPLESHADDPSLKLWQLYLMSERHLVTSFTIFPTRHSVMNKFSLDATHHDRQNPVTGAESTNSQMTLDYSMSLALTKKWLTECLTSHNNCLPRAERPLPSRLLYFESGQLQLCLRSKILNDISYVTLSHCWGDLNILKLTKNTLEAFQLGIPLESLCKTFRDAIFVAGYLGFNYLWIDSLCIIQDDREDWEKEAPLMSMVYGGASLNIAATGAKDGNDGLFLERVPMSVRRSKTCVKMDVNGETKNFQFADDDIYYRCVGTQPLARRAWALQERILATRTIHFSKTELFWECRTKSACETFPESLPRSMCDQPNFLRKDLPPDWDAIVQLYSIGRLSYSRDKLIALSGIAQYVQSITKDQYLAGLWRRDLEETLCWKLLDSPEPKPTIYRAPTWSWASVEGMIMITCSLPSNLRRLYINVMDVLIQRSHNNQFGEVLSGVLKLGCEALLRGSFVRTLSIDSTASWDFSDVLPGRALYFMPVKRYASGPTDRTEGMIIQPTSKERGQYQRVGHFRIVGGSNCDKLDEGLPSADIVGEPDDCDVTETITDNDNKKWYVITII